MRLPAIKRVLESMTKEEKAVLHAEQEKMMTEGYLEKRKRRYVLANADASADADAECFPV